MARTTLTKAALRTNARRLNSQKIEQATSMLKSGIPLPAPTQKTSVKPIMTKKDKDTRSPLQKKKGKSITEMTDQEFEAFAVNMTDKQYWEHQAQRGVYKPRGDGQPEQTDEYEDEEY